jgi:hypothetical protein
VQAWLKSRLAGHDLRPEALHFSPTETGSSAGPGPRGNPVQFETWQNVQHTGMPSVLPNIKLRVQGSRPMSDVYRMGPV